MTKDLKDVKKHVTRKCLLREALGQEPVRNSEKVELSGQTGEYRRESQRMKEEDDVGMRWSLQNIKGLIVGVKRRITHIGRLCLPSPRFWKTNSKYIITSNLPQVLQMWHIYKGVEGYKVPWEIQEDNLMASGNLGRLPRRENI